MESTTSTSTNDRAQPMPNSPFFRPSNPRVSRTGRPSIVVKNRLGGDAEEIPVKDIEKKTSVIGAYANLCNVTIGAGIVGLPFAIKEAGLVAGTVMIIGCAFLTDYSLRQIISTGKVVNVNSYETLMESSFGRLGFIFVSASMFFLSYGSMVAYLIIIKDVLPVLFHVTPHDVDIKRVIMFVSSLLIIVPLSMQRDMADLEKTSRLNVILNISLVGLVALFSPVNESVQTQGGILQMIADEPLLDLTTFFVGFGVCSFAFVCQDSSFIIAGSMKTPSKQRWKQVTNGAMMTCCVLELTMGISGYLAYQTNTLGNVLNNMNAHHWSGVVSRAMLSTTMFFAYPMNLYIARHAFVALFFEGTSAHEGDDSVALMRQDRRVILTWVLYVASIIPAALMESTGKVLAVTGAIAGSSIAYIGPGLTFLAVHSSIFIELVRKRWNVTPAKLWGYPWESMDNHAGNESNTSKHLNIVAEDNEQRTINQKSIGASALDIFFWYAFGMPIWSMIAMIGQQKLAEHFEKEDRMSPGVVKPKRVSLMKPTWHHEHASARFSGKFVPSDPSMNVGTNSSEQTMLLQPAIGSTYGTDSVDRNLLLNERGFSFSPEEAENELKTEVPTWSDFCIAIAYIVLGVVAMIFGLVSILLL